MTRRPTVAALLAAATAAALYGSPTAVAEPGCADLGGTIDGAAFCQIHVNDPDYTLNLEFPTDYPDQQTLTDYLVQNRDGFLSVAQRPATRGIPYEMDATAERYQSGQPPHGTSSVVLKVFQTLGGPHPSTWYKSFNYDRGRQQPITFDTLFAPGAKPLEAIAPLVQRDLEGQLGWRAAMLPGTGTDPAHYQNFAITDDELIFFFAPGELLPLAAGEASARVARDAIPPLALG